jgi:hypothetical protein
MSTAILSRKFEFHPFVIHILERFGPKSPRQVQLFNQSICKRAIFKIQIASSLKMKGSYLPLSLLLVVLVLGSNRVLSFSSIDISPGCHSYRLSSRLPKTPLVELRANNDDDSKIDWNPESRPKIAELPSYSDDWLLNFHNWDQSEKQLVTNSLTTWNDEIRNEQANIIEWQDSFQRNDLADFTPPMSNGLNCLMVGDALGNDDGSRRVRLPWEEESEAQITSLRVLEESAEDILEDNMVTEMTEENKITDDNYDDDDDDEIIITINCDDDKNEDEDQAVSGVPLAAVPLSKGSMCGTNGGMVRTELVSRAPGTTSTSSESSSTMRVRDPNKYAAAYDCIVDQGLMDRILVLENSHETIRELLEEAAIAIKELGIYVLVTKDLSEDSRKILEDYGLKAGLEWQFELDGISDDTQVVSVARRFCNGVMPKVGRLSRYQPERFW